MKAQRCVTPIFVAGTDRPQARLVSLSAKSLDIATERINRLASQVIGATWDLGKELQLVNDNQLWKCRLDHFGDRTYTGFESYCEAETIVSRQTVYAAIKLVTSYSSPKVAQDIGTTKAFMIQKAPAKERAQLIEQCRAGMSKRRLQEAIKHLRNRDGWHDASLKALAGMLGGAAKARKHTKHKDTGSTDTGSTDTGSTDTDRIATLERALRAIVACSERGRFERIARIASDALTEKG